MIDRTHADLEVPREVRWIVDTLEQAGHSAWTVGGGVRDALAGLAPEDWDITTSARPGEVQRLFRRTVPIGVEHGTVGVIARTGRMYEVTTFRRDVETFGRKARVEFAESLDEDLERRDFTINAVAWNPRTGELRDPHGGRADLERGILRTVGDPEARFAEDRLRVLRALRFAGRYDLRIEDATWAAVRASAGQLGNLSAERVREELMKVLSGQRRPSRTLRLYAASGVLAELFPEIAFLAAPENEEVWESVLGSVDAVPRHRPLLRLAVLLHRAGGGEGNAQKSAAAARALMRRLRCSNADTDRVTHLIAHSHPIPGPDTPEPELLRWLRRVGRDYVRDVIRLLVAICRGSGGAVVSEDVVRALWRRSSAALRARIPLSVRELPVTGADLKAAGIPPGPLYGAILDRLLERVTDDPRLNDREILLEMLAREAEASEPG